MLCRNSTSVIINTTYHVLEMYTCQILFTKNQNKIFL